ncbi:cAMP-regulated phosphoprotein 21 isoform X2 [Periplaneta americana]|uniref:cAMP-regulated phosphoprotein 21 isoform X2 n=1 Tax=Periplaneta americana TaxID=6978 RepID=UPI0037E803BB
MARLEIPSIVVHNGSNSAPGSPTMERSLRAQRTLSKQAEFEELEEDESVPHLSSPSSSPADDNPPSPVSCNHKVKEDASQQQLQRADSLDIEDKSPPPSRVRSHAKVKLLVRSHAMREETSPPPDPDAHHIITPVPQQQQQQQLPQTNSNNSLSVGRPSSRHKLRHQGSSQGSMDSSSPCLSRDSSTEQYTDSTGVDLQQFITDTLNRNQKDRILLLKIEQELVNLAKDNKRNHYKFPQMSSYQRMLVHRVAAYFGMDHNVDQTGNAVIVNRTKNTRLPETKFRDHIREELLFPEEPRRSILKRDSSSFEESCNFKSPERQFSSESRRSKSFEEREEEYEKARKRIFNREDGCNDPLHDSSRRSSQEELRWPGEVQPWSSSDSDTSSRLRSNVLLHASDNNQLRPTRLLKVESFEGRDTLKANSLRLSVSKSYSFGGYPVTAVLSRGDSCTSTHSAGARLLTKQDSGSSMSSRLSPSSSGYKSQSQRSDTTMSATPSPTATPVSQLSISSSNQPQISSHGALSPQHTPESNSQDQNQTVMWAVTSMASVPPGSVLINPQTGQPYVNSDGSVYRYDPANPPKVVTDDESESGSGSGGPLVTPAGTSSHHQSAGSSEQVQPPAQKSHPVTTSSSATSPSKTTCSTHVTTTATSPSLPISPPPVPLPNSTVSTSSNTAPATSQIPAPSHQPVLTICHSSQCSYIPNPGPALAEQQQPLGTLPLAPIPICPQLANTGAQTHSYQHQQFMSALQHQPSDMVFGAQQHQMPAPAPSQQCHSQQPAAPQMVFTGYNMVPMPPTANGTTAMAGYEQRHSDGASVAMSDLSSYFMGLGLVSDQRGGGDSSSTQQAPQQPPTAAGVMPAPPPLHQSHHPHNYQPQPPAPAVAAATAAAYWQPQQQSSPIQHTQQQPQPQQQQPPQPPAQQPLPMYYVPPALPAPPPPPPPPPSGPMLNTSPPQQATTNNSNQATPRYLAAYSPYQQAPGATPLCHPSGPSLPPPVQTQTHQDRPQAHSGGYMSNYPVVSYGAAVPAPVMAATGNGDCMPLYTQPSIHMLYTPTSINVNSLSSSSSSATTSAMPGGGTLPYYHPPSTPTAHSQPTVMGLGMGPPYMQPSQPGTAMGAYRAPTPPQTPTQGQALCNMATHPYVYLNGGGYTPVYNGGGTSGNAPTPGPYSQQPAGTPSTPGPTQYIPPTIISNLGLFRSNMQMMSSVRSSPPPRPPRDGIGSKPPYSRSPSVGSKERGNGTHHYDMNDKSVTSMRYPSVPMFGLRIMPGDMRVMGQQSLSASSPALRMPFTLPPHPAPTPTSHRLQQQPAHYPLGSQSSGSEVSIGSVGRPPKPRKQRSKVTATIPTSAGRSSLPPQASGTAQSQAANVSLPTAVEGTGGQDAGRVLMMNEGSPSKQH